MGHGPPMSRGRRTAASGHEDPFPRPGPSARCRFSQGTFAGTRGNGRDAPLPAIHHAITIGEVRPTWRRRALPWSGGHTVDGILLLGIADIFSEGKTASDGLSGSGSAARPRVAAARGSTRHRSAAAGRTDRLGSPRNCSCWRPCGSGRLYWESRMSIRSSPDSGSRDRGSEQG